MTRLYVASFPINRERSIDDLVLTVRRWISGSPHYGIRMENLEGLERDGFSYDSPAGIKITSLASRDDNEQWAARMFNSHSGVVYTSEVSGMKSQEGFLFLATLDYSAQKLGQFIHGTRSPRIANNVLTELGGDYDGKTLCVKNTPHLLSEDDLAFVEDVLANKSGNELPVVYLSRDRNGLLSFNPGRLAKILGGLAHVLVEPSNDFSFRLYDNSRRDRKTYLGFAGIYWPSGVINRISPGEESEEQVAYLVKNHSLERIVHPELTYEGIRRHQTLREIRQLSEEKENIGNKALELAIDEIESRDKELSDLRRELAKSVSLQQARVSANIGLDLETPEGIPQLYDGELRDLVLEALELFARQYTLEESRRRNMLERILNVNNSTGMRDEIIEGLERIFVSNPRHFNERVANELRALGFGVDLGSGLPHPKIYVPGDDSNWATAPSTPSDSRSGKNVIATIKRKLL